MERGFANADDRRGRRASRSIETGIVETGDDEGVGAARLADLLDQPRNRERLVVIALDAGRTKIGIDRRDLDPGRSRGPGRRADLVSVIERVVFGLTTWIRMRVGPSDMPTPPLRVTRPAPKGLRPVGSRKGG